MKTPITVLAAARKEAENPAKCLAERGAGWWVFRAVFHVVNALLGRWGNSLKAVAIKREAWSGAD